MENEVLTVSEFNNLINQTLGFAYPLVVIEGEIASFKVNQGKWVFFDLKDADCTIGCFMPIYHLNVPLEDGMLVKVAATPNLTKWGKFSITIKEVELSGEGAVKKAFDILKAKFEREGLFALERKRPLPQYPKNIALVTSKQAAAFNDFLKIVGDRWRGLNIIHAQVQVQGIDSPRQIVSAINYFNEHPEQSDVLVVIRGGGSAEDLQAFNHEDVVRAVYGSKIPCLVGIGHEDDISLAELAADQRAATPSDAARRLVPDMTQVISSITSLQNQSSKSVISLIKQSETQIERINHVFMRRYGEFKTRLSELGHQNDHSMERILRYQADKLAGLLRVLTSLNPKAILARGYSVATILGQVVMSEEQIQPEDLVVLQLYQGRVELKLNKGGSGVKQRIKRPQSQSQKGNQTRLKF